VKNAFRKPYKGDIIETNFQRGRFFVPVEERESILNTVEFIKNNTRTGERIYVGNIAHWKDDFGGSLQINDPKVAASNHLLVFVSEVIPAFPGVDVFDIQNIECAKVFVAPVFVAQQAAEYFFVTQLAVCTVAYPGGAKRMQGAVHNQTIQFIANGK